MRRPVGSYSCPCSGDDILPLCHPVGDITQSATLPPLPLENATSTPPPPIPHTPPSTPSPPSPAILPLCRISPWKALHQPPLPPSHTHTLQPPLLLSLPSSPLLLSRGI